MLVTPSDPKESEELTTIAAKLKGTYGKGKWCADPKKSTDCLDIEQITHVMATSRDEKTLRTAWEGWHTILVPMKNDYARLVELGNKGANELGFADTGAMWRLKYDMPADEFTKELDRLWARKRGRSRLMQQSADSKSRPRRPIRLLIVVLASVLFGVAPVRPSAEPTYTIT